MRGAPRQQRASGRPGCRRGTRPGAGGAAHRREATAAPQGSRRSIAESGAGLAARRARGGLATSAWAALGPAPAAARPAPVLPGRGSSRSRALALPGSPRAAAAPRRSRDPPTVGGRGGGKERERETPRARDHAGSVTLRYVTSRHGPRCTPGAGMEPRLRNSPSLHVIARLRPALSTAPRAVPGAARRRTSSRHLHVTAGSAPSSRPRRAVTGRPAFLSEQIADPARIPVGRGAEQSSTASPGPRSAPPRAGSDGSRSGSGRCSPAERSAAPSQNNGRKRSHHLGRRIRPRNGSSTWESF